MAIFNRPGNVVEIPPPPQTVPRDLHDALQQRYDALLEKWGVDIAAERGRFDALLEKYDRLRLAGAAPAPEPKPGRVVAAGPTSEERAYNRFVEEIARDVEHMAGVDPVVAKQEAERIRLAAFGAEGGT